MSDYDTIRRAPDGVNEDDPRVGGVEGEESKRRDEWQLSEAYGRARVVMGTCYKRSRGEMKGGWQREIRDDEIMKVGNDRTVIKRRGEKISPS